ncbi:hypothetical protein HK105_207470 [Polyrhizophydium stewartii]|uniref:Helicase C-terminal domain-containing protein n=1 Tax=Polyrhizophydium stewartii TaxID=2732419 RepID=A0ABR4N0K0_9FUNG
MPEPVDGGGGDTFNAPRLDALELMDAAVGAPALQGMRSPLYGYQRRSLWKLLQRELAPRIVLPPHLLPLSRADLGVSGQDTSADTMQPCIDLGTGMLSRVDMSEMRASGQMYSDCCGGIICEEMGTGKTILCLSLIMSTRHHTSLPPAGAAMCVEWLHPAGGSADGHRGGARPLKDLAAAALAAQGWSLENLDHMLPAEVLQSVTPFRLSYLKHPPPSISARSAVRSDGDGADASRLAELNQPIRINKHIDGPELRYVVIADGNAPVPDARALAGHHLVIMSSSRFGLEHKRGGLSWTWGVPRACECPYVGRTRTRDCRCPRPADKYVSPLLQVRWLRLVVDEGHTMARKGMAHATQQVAMAASLECERRWVCTGTPMQSSIDRFSPSVEASDIAKLGALLATFLKCEPFASKEAMFHRILATCPRSFKYAFLASIMDRVMVRNQQEDVMRDVALPPLNVSTVVLEFNELQRRVYNCMLGMIALNAVLSQREDQDYFFHKRNVKPLAQAVNNVLASCQWLGGAEFMSAIEHAHENVKKALDKDPEQKYPPDDVQTLHRVRDVFASVLEDPVWRRVVNEIEAPFVVEGLGESVAWQPIASGVQLGARDGLDCLGWNTISLFRKRALAHVQSQASASRPDVAEPANPAQSIAQPGEAAAHESERLPWLHSSSARIVGTLSAKWTYMLDRIRFFHDRGEKMLVVVQSNHEVAALHDLCQAARVRCLLFHRQMAIKERARNITTFNTSDSIWVMVMEAEIGAWGIDLSSAASADALCCSRVFFISPIWRADLERQAIKRAHRIGSKRPVYVETLVMAGTIEEQIVGRKTEIDAADVADSSKSMTLDVKMQQMIKEPVMLPMAADASVALLSWRMQPTLSTPIALLDRGSTHRDFYDVEPGEARDGEEQETSQPGRSAKRKRDDGLDAGRSPSNAEEKENSAAPAGQPAEAGFAPSLVDRKPKVVRFEVL